MQFAPGEVNFLRRILRENRCANGALAFTFTTHFCTGGLLAKGHYGTLAVSRLSRKTTWSGDRIIIGGKCR